MATIAFVLHHQRREAVELVRDATVWLVERGHEVRLPSGDASHAGLTDHGCNNDELLHDLGLVVSLGGDGTMLRAVDLVADRDVPVLGINLGQLGYLTEVEPAGLRMALKRYLAGSYDIEQRMRLAVTIDAPSGAGPASGTFSALNEAVVGKTPAGQV
ncbi:MAG: NAD(+)/NADH kinase, partial [Actinobacteria bacterium]|nr:NAD(+)/NADH kinase [Actinomycetota bacterium]